MTSIFERYRALFKIQCIVILYIDYLFDITIQTGFLAPYCIQWLYRSTTHNLMAVGLFACHFSDLSADLLFGTEIALSNGNNG
jgi:hypothetical protein